MADAMDVSLCLQRRKVVSLCVASLHDAGATLCLPVQEKLRDD
jgi:hypothetical protein